LKHAAEEVRKREKKSEAKMVGVLHLVRESKKREHMAPPHQRERERKGSKLKEKKEILLCKRRERERG